MNHLAFPKQRPQATVVLLVPEQLEGMGVPMKTFWCLKSKKEYKNHILHIILSQKLEALLKTKCGFTEGDVHR